MDSIGLYISGHLFRHFELHYRLFCLLAGSHSVHNVPPFFINRWPVQSLYFIVSPNRHRQAVHAMLFDQAGDQTAGCGLFDEGAQKFSAVCVVLVCADGLLDGGELTVEDARAGEFLDVTQQAWFETGEGFQLLIDEELKCTVNALGMHQCGVFDVGNQP